jgi:hypothetical protein
LENAMNRSTKRNANSKQANRPAPHSAGAKAQRRQQRAAQAASPAPQEQYRDVETMRWALVRKIEAFVAARRWPECRHRPCQRARTCKAPPSGCVGPWMQGPWPTSLDEKRRVWLKAELERRLAEFEANGFKP